MGDLKLQCKDCQAEFIFTEKEQAYFQKKGLHQPKRCKACRDMRRQERDKQDQQTG